MTQLIGQEICVSAQVALRTSLPISWPANKNVEYAGRRQYKPRTIGLPIVMLSYPAIDAFAMQWLMNGHECDMKFNIRV